MQHVKKPYKLNFPIRYHLGIAILLSLRDVLKAILFFIKTNWVIKWRYIVVIRLPKDYIAFSS